MMKEKIWWKEEGVRISAKAKAFFQHYDPTKIKKIAVLRQSALGDMLITRPFLLEAKKLFPNAKITFCATDNCPSKAVEDLVDEIYTVTSKQRKKQTRFSQRLREFAGLAEQDIVFDLCCTNRSRYLALLTKAKLKVSYPRSVFQAKYLYDVALQRDGYCYEAESMLHQLMIFGHVPPRRLDFALPDHQNENDPQTFSICVFPGSSMPDKCYPIERLKSVVSQAAQQHPEISFNILEGMNQDEKIHHWESILAQYSNVHFQPLLGLDELALFLAKSNIVVSNDTSIRNMAAATHTPTLGLFVNTIPYRYTPRYENHYLSFAIKHTATRSVLEVEQVVADLNHAIEDLRR